MITQDSKRKFCCEAVQSLCHTTTDSQTRFAKRNVCLSIHVGITKLRSPSRQDLLCVSQGT